MLIKQLGMILNINHQSKIYPSSLANLEELIHLELKSNNKGIAVALNQQVIPKDSWSQTPLKENDSILIITATQGG